MKKLILISILFLNSFVIISQTDSTKKDICQEAINDARVYHKRQGLFIAAGSITGIGGIIAAIASKPSPVKDAKCMENSKNKELFKNETYLKCYKKKARSQNINNASTGFLLITILILIL